MMRRFAISIALFLAIALIIVLNHSGMNTRVEDLTTYRWGERILNPLDVRVNEVSTEDGVCKIVITVNNTNPHDVTVTGIDVYVTDENGKMIYMRTLKVDRTIRNSGTFVIEIPRPPKYSVIEGFIVGVSDGKEVEGYFRKVVH